VRPYRIVVDAPGLDDPSLGQQGEDVLVEAFVTHPATEALDEAVPHEPAGRDVVPLDALLGRPAQHDIAGQLRTVVADDRHRLAANRHDGLQPVDHSQAEEREVRDRRQVLVVDHVEQPEPPVVTQLIADEVE